MSIHWERSAVRQSAAIQPQSAGELPHDHLGDQHLEPLTGTAELHDVRAQVRPLDHARHRAALAQRRDVADGGDVVEHVPQASRPRALRRSTADSMG